MKEESNLVIPEPCHESWDRMHPREQGRFCDQCCKVVIDFTTKTKEEILHFLRAAGKGVCGRVNDEVLAPVPVKTTSSNWKVFLAAVYFVFGAMLFTSCASQKQRRTRTSGWLVEQKQPEKPDVPTQLTPQRK